MPVSREESQAKLDLLTVKVMAHTPEQSYTVADRFEEHATNIPNNPFLIYNDQSISYAELNRQANRYADIALQQGLKKGDVAALMIENRPAFFYAWLALAKIGVIAALINTQSRGRALQNAIDITDSKLLFLGSESLSLFKTVDALAEQVPTLLIIDEPGEDLLIPPKALPIEPLLQSAVSENPAKSLRAGVIGETPLFYVFTSGTTGMPKAALLSHMRWLGVGDGWSNMLGICSEDVFYCVLPLFHGAAGMSLVSNAVSAGAAVVLRRRFSASRFWDDVRHYGVTTVQYIGEVCRYLVNQPVRENDKDHSLKRMTGAGMSREVWNSFISRFGDIDIYEGWGATESNCNMINMDNIPGSCGRLPFKDRSNARLVKYDLENDCHRRDENGFLLECEAGEAGELIGMVLNIPGVGAGRFEGYTDKKATENKILHNVFSEGDAWYRSGDLFTRDEDDYYYFLDRIGDTYRWKSENISTTEVTEELAAYHAIEIVNVYGVKVPGEEGKAGMAAIQLKDGEIFNPKEFYQHVIARLPAYAVPLFIRVSEQSDMTATFKLKKVDLQKQAYNLALVSEPLYMLDGSEETYCSLTKESLSKQGFQSSS